MEKVIAMPPELMRRAEEAVWGDWAQENEGKTCLDCKNCETMEDPIDEAVEAALGYRIGFCREYCDWVTDRCTVEELGNVGVCFGEW